MKALGEWIALFTELYRSARSDSGRVKSLFWALMTLWMVAFGVALSGHPSVDGTLQLKSGETDSVDEMCKEDHR